MKFLVFVVLLAGCSDDVTVTEVCDPARQEQAFADCMVAARRARRLNRYTYLSCEDAARKVACHQTCEVTP